MYRIDKRIDFCYGHRVWSQNLDEGYCAQGDTKMKCRHLHGHEGSVHVFLESEELERGFVTDFKHLGWLKDFIDEYIDHKFIVDLNDPGLDRIVGARYQWLDWIETTGDWNEKKEVPGLVLFEPQTSNTTQVKLDSVLVDGVHVGYRVDCEAAGLSGSTKEIIEGFFFVSFVPTSENLAKWIYDIVDRKMKQINVQTSRIEWFETPKSRSTYIGNK